MISWVPISQLKEPFNDAVNYRSREEKELFNKVFLRTAAADRILRPATYYVVGEKGTGKTAYATYLENTSYQGTKCSLVTITETQYMRFMQLKKRGQLNYSDYASIWRSTLLLLVSEMVIARNKGVLNSYTGKFTKLEGAISQWSKFALNPEVGGALQALESDSVRAALGRPSVAQIALEEKVETKSTTSTISHNVMLTEIALKEAFADLRLADGHILFVDGIDFRPENIPYEEYLDCVKGLGEAAWQLDTEFFNRVRDSKGRAKIVLLLRPDVFHKLNLYNSNSRIQDNTVLLTWFTTDAEYKASPLYEVCGRFFAAQQPHPPTYDEAWCHYFPQSDTFCRLLHISFQRPRDILTFIRFFKSYQKSSSNETSFDSSLISNARFTREAADYLLGEVRNYSAFYMSPDDFGTYLKFFQYLDGKARFSMNSFVDAYDGFVKWSHGEKVVATEYLRDPDALLQLFYDVNVIGYREDATDASQTFVHWSFRERTINNIAPKVKDVQELLINPGVAKALDIGKQFTSRSGAPGHEERRRRPQRGRGRRGKR